MPRELGLPVFYKFDELKEGAQLVVKGEYVGSTQSKMGPNFNFIEIESGRHVVLSGGSLRWRIEQGDISEGGVYDIYYEGKDVLTKGEWKGKKSLKFKLEVYSKREIAELVAAGAVLRNELPEVEEIKDERKTDANETLGDLE